MSRRRQILDSIATRISATTGLTRVEPWRRASFAPGNLPAIAWRDRVSQADNISLTGTWQRLEVAYAGYGGSAATARDLLAGIIEAIGSDLQHDGLAVLTDYRQSSIGLTVAGDLVAGCELWIDILYQILAEDLGGDSYRLKDENDNNLTDENGDTLTW